MANQEHLAILKQGVEAWNAWRKANPEIKPNLREVNFHSAIEQVSWYPLGGDRFSRPDLRMVNFSGTDLSGAYLSRTDVAGADFSGANLFRADLSDTEFRWNNFSKASLHRANLLNSDLHSADLHEADLNGADLSGTNLYRANLQAANLTLAVLNTAEVHQTDFSGAIAFRTTFANLDLRTAHGLATIRHNGPSIVGIDTLYRSDGQIPEAFLRGCGVPDSFIDSIPHLFDVLQPIQFYSCFISYSTKDEEFARRLHERMRAEHLRVWFAPEDIQGGKKIHEQIDQAIRVYDKLVLIVSEHSLASEWVMQELRRARRAELEKKQRKLFPIRLVDYNALQTWECIDSRTGADLAEEVRQYFIPDFSHWKEHDAFEAAFARLLRDLKATEAPAP
jgi:hypothetical protein